MNYVIPESHLILQKSIQGKVRCTRLSYMRVVGSGWMSEKVSCGVRLNTLLIFAAHISTYKSMYFFWWVIEYLRKLCINLIIFLPCEKLFGKGVASAVRLRILNWNSYIQWNLSKKAKFNANFAKIYKRPSVFISLSYIFLAKFWIFVWLSYIFH